MFLSSFHHSAGRALRRGPVRGPSALAHHGCQCTPLVCGGDAGRRAECGRLVWWGGNAMVGGSSVLHLPYFIFSFLSSCSFLLVGSDARFSTAGVAVSLTVFGLALGAVLLHLGLAQWPGVVFNMLGFGKTYDRSALLPLWRPKR